MDRIEIRLDNAQGGGAKLCITENKNILENVQLGDTVTDYPEQDDILLWKGEVKKAKKTNK